MEEFVISPTAYDEARAKERKLTPKQVARAKAKQLRIHMDAYSMIYAKGTSGMQYAKLQQIDEWCKREQVEVPIYVKWMLLVHKAVLAK